MRKFHATRLPLFYPTGTAYFSKIRPQRMKAKEFLQKKLLKQLIFRHYKNMPPEERTPEWEEVIGWLRKNRLSVFPYSFTARYDPAKIELRLDEKAQRFYTIYQGHRLYYRDGENARRARRYFNSVFLEQDPHSPHRYLSGDFDVEEGDVVVDVGAAEGNFSLDVVERAGKIYLFEPDPAWQEALRLTFAPWKEKVEIIPKMVGAVTDDTHVALDDFFRERRPSDFIKIDVDGAEAEVLKGMEDLLNEKRIRKIALCTYHRQEDAGRFARHLEKLGYHVSFSHGYMIFRKRLRPPYLRRGVLKAVLP